MSFGQWLNSLTWIEHIVILFFFILASYFTHLTLKGFRSVILKSQKNPYAIEFRTSPFMFFALAIPYTILLYRIFGSYIVQFMKTIF